MITVKCPYCKTVFTTTINTATSCRNPNCRARLHIDSNGIRRSEPPKKKK